MKSTNLLTTVTLSVIIIILIAFRPEEKPQIVCFGDSITYGARAEGKSWVYFLNKNHPEVEFINAGRSGRRTADKKELLPVLEKYPNADQYLIFLGVNDLKNGNDSLVQSNVENMRWMIAEIRKINTSAKIVLLAPTDINLKTMDSVNIKKQYNQNTKTSLYHLKKAYRKLAKAENVQFISLLHAVGEANFADGLHPNVAGQQQIAHAVWKGLRF